MAKPRPALVDPALLRRFRLKNPMFVTETGIAKIWRVTRANGDQAALKVYHQGRMGNETHGVAFLRHLNGTGAAMIYDEAPGIILSEWLSGPHLGDLTRSGQDAVAAHHLVDVARRLHGASGMSAKGLPLVSDWLDALFQLKFASECPAPLKSDVLKCQSIARTLLSAPRDTCVLHGDLHHDNIRGTSRGYCAFDAKGVVGDKAYELANGFRNPKGAAAIQRDPQRIAFLAQTWASAFGVAEDHLRAWAAVKCALSIAWRSKGHLRDDLESDLLSLLLKDV
ncbi:aminoglycoside phosphotransferase family protein [Ascidiaceihabitans sp.]|uniref:aminoglycoside phosphotransferase family protein n=1 Tax=Ascidiaceihabitans sp. TaxID=1872644 RepID=UPI003297725A